MVGRGRGSGSDMAAAAIKAGPFGALTAAGAAFMAAAAVPGYTRKPTV